MYTGDNLQTVSVWKRNGDTEYPIYANTRGVGEWFSFDANVQENTTDKRLSDDVIEFLAHIYRVNNGKIETDSESMFWADMVADDRPDVDLEWYETEFVNMINQPGMTPEQEELLEWAYNEVNND